MIDSDIPKLIKEFDSKKSRELLQFFGPEAFKEMFFSAVNKIDDSEIEDLETKEKFIKFIDEIINGMQEIIEHEKAGEAIIKSIIPDVLKN